MTLCLSSSETRVLVYMEQMSPDFEDSMAIKSVLAVSGCFCNVTVFHIYHISLSVHRLLSTLTDSSLTILKIAAINMGIIVY
jgi:hypothetical protein